ncbi:MAG TPA: HDIG domain-containing protein [Candidatus Aquicultor sp.]|jgi:hypothetical protein
MGGDFGLKQLKELSVKVDWRGTGLRRSILVFFIFTVILAILTIDFLPDRLTGVQVGKPSTKTVKATRDIEFIDVEKTEALRKEAATHIQKMYSRDWTVESQATDLIHKFYSSVRQTRDNQVLLPAAKLDILSKEVGPDFDRSILQTALAMPDADLSATELMTANQIDQVYRDRITVENLGSKRSEFEDSVRKLTSDSNKNALVVGVGKLYLKANYFYDKDVTENLKKDAKASVSPVIVNKQKGETVVREGEIVTSSQVRILRELGLMTRGIDLMRLAGLTLFALVSFLAFGLYLYHYEPKVFKSDRLIAVLGIIFLVTVLAAKFVGPFYSFFVIPVGAAAMLTALLFNSQTAVLMTLMLSIYSGLLAGQNYQYALYGLFTGLFAIFAINNIRHRTDLVLSGAWVTAASTMVALITTLLSGAAWVDVFKNLGWGLVGGISTAVLAIGGLPFLEKVFGITTDIKLVELSYPNQPLLREMMMKAPGTHNHSVMTGNLAETAAEEIGANPLLARVGAYYHDIGKTKRPMFFVENQIGGDNPHDHTNPSLSCLIITSHVKEGVELAKKYRLPDEIVDIINQHHGTSVVQYFFHKAKENIAKETICEENFRYAGRKPSSKEAALVMLADSVEAAARTITKPSPGRIEQLIKRIVQSKLDDGQLSESNLTLNDIEKIIKSFTQVLSSLYHTRIEYPTAQVPQTRSLVSHGHPHK